jgi:hypothetical protein
VADRADDLRAVLAAAGADTLQAYRGRVGHQVAVTPADTETTGGPAKKGGAV